MSPGTLQNAEMGFVARFWTTPNLDPLNLQTNAAAHVGNLLFLIIDSREKPLTFQPETDPAKQILRLKGAL